VLTYFSSTAINIFLPPVFSLPCPHVEEGRVPVGLTDAHLYPAAKYIYGFSSHWVSEQIGSGTGQDLHSPLCHKIYIYFSFVGSSGNKPEGRGFETRVGHWISSIYLILPSATGPGVYSASNRNEYQKYKKKCFLGVELGNLWAHCLDNVGSLTSHNHVGLHGLLRG
jgi:hypothetical protein